MFLRAAQWLLAIALIVAPRAAVSQERYTPIYPFTTDGCSGGVTYLYKLVHREEPPYQACCRKHDEAYWRGGTSDQRAQADAQLYQCVKQYRSAVWARIMWIAVRFGGQPYFPLTWRWGYGIDYSACHYYDCMESAK